MAALRTGWVLLPLVSVLLAACGGGDGGGGAKPVAGGFGGNLNGASFTVLLVVAKSGGDVVDQVQVFCAPQNQISGSGTVGEKVRIDGGEFTAKSKDVEIQGKFVSSTRAEGDIRALSEDAAGCGVPRAAAKWTATCRLGKVKPRKQSGGGITIGTTYAAGGGGTEVIHSGAGQVDVSKGPCAGGAQ